MKALFAGLLLVVVQVQAAQVVETGKVVEREEVNNWGTLKAGYFPRLFIDKVCIDGQLYLVTHNKEYATGITPALVKGVPRQCENSVKSAPAVPAKD